MVQDNGELAPLESDPPDNRCKRCEACLDDHQWRLNGFYTMQPVCVLRGERIAGEPRGPAIELGWLEFLMSGLEEETT